jgi:hypothetical protein
MYIVDRPPRRPAANRSPFPTYDVKIIAGRRVVIFHEKEKEVNKPNTTEVETKVPEIEDIPVKPEEQTEEKQISRFVYYRPFSLVSPFLHSPERGRHYHQGRATTVF